MLLIGVARLEDTCVCNVYSDMAEAEDNSWGLNGGPFHQELKAVHLFFLQIE